MTEDEIIRYIAERIRAHRRNTYLDLLDRAETVEVDLTLAANIVSFVRGHPVAGEAGRPNTPDIPRISYDDFVSGAMKFPPGKYVLVGAIWDEATKKLRRSDRAWVEVSVSDT